MRIWLWISTVGAALTGIGALHTGHSPTLALCIAGFTWCAVIAIGALCAIAARSDRRMP